jgi:hypothetical protein
MSLPITLEVNLRVPDVSVKTPDASVRRITNSDSRFLKVCEVPALPQIGDNLELSTRSYVFNATVKRLDWHDDQNRFVVACHYGKRSMTPEEYDGLRADPDWTMTSLV